MARSSRFDQGD